MAIADIKSFKKLPCSYNCCKITDGTYDGCHYYFAAENSILKICLKNMRCCTIKTSHNYCFITYDCKHKEFIAIDYGCNKRIYFLDKDLNEKKSVALNITKPLKIDSISYYKEKDCIIISTRERNILVDKCGKEIKSNLKLLCCQNYVSIFALGCFFITLYTDSHSSYIYLYYENKIIEKYCLNKKIFYPIEILSVNCNTDDELLYITLLTVNYNREYFTVTININVHEYKKFICLNDCKDSPCPADNSTTYDIIESIALMEAGLSHIVNAEGEKLQKAIKLSNCVEDLININKSVDKTLLSVTNIENLLYQKLMAVLENYDYSTCKCKDKKNSDDNCKND